MALSEVVIACLVISLTLYIVAIAVDAWPCGGLFRQCHGVSGNNTAALVYDYNVIGGLLIVCIILAGVSLICSLIALLLQDIWIRIVAYATSFIAFVLALTMEIFFHTRIHYDWSSFLTTVGATFCFHVFFVQTTDLVYRKCRPEAHFTPEFM